MPPLTFSARSSRRRGMPNARVTGLWLLLVSTCAGWSVPDMSGRNSVETFENHTWCSDGARKPVLIAPRTDTGPAIFARAAALPISERPKSL
jgi:hypothetical protein